MTQTLDDFHREIAAGISEICAQCMRPTPDIPALGTARLRLSQVSSARAQHVREMLMPALRARADAASLRELDELLRQFTANRVTSSQHVAMWSSKAIAANWKGYCQAARHIWAMMEEQIDRERRLFGLATTARRGPAT